MRMNRAKDLYFSGLGIGPNPKQHPCRTLLGLTHLIYSKRPDPFDLFHEPWEIPFINESLFNPEPTLAPTVDPKNIFQTFFPLIRFFGWNTLSGQAGLVGTTATHTIAQQHPNQNGPHLAAPLTNTIKLHSLFKMVIPLY